MGGILGVLSGVHVQKTIALSTSVVFREGVSSAFRATKDVMYYISYKGFMRTGTLRASNIELLVSSYEISTVTVVDRASFGPSGRSLICGAGSLGMAAGTFIAFCDFVGWHHNKKIFVGICDILVDWGEWLSVHASRSPSYGWTQVEDKRTKKLCQSLSVLVDDMYTSFCPGCFRTSDPEAVHCTLRKYLHTISVMADDIRTNHKKMTSDGFPDHMSDTQFLLIGRVNRFSYVMRTMNSAQRARIRERSWHARDTALLTPAASNDERSLPAVANAP